MTAGAIMCVTYPFIMWSFVFWTTNRYLLLFIQAFHFSLLDTCATFPGTLSMQITFQCVTNLSCCPHKERSLCYHDSGIYARTFLMTLELLHIFLWNFISTSPADVCCFAFVLFLYHQQSKYAGLVNLSAKDTLH